METKSENTQLRFSFFVGGIIATVPIRQIELVDFITLIRTDKYEDQIITLRNEKDKNKQHILKSKLDFCIPSGVFTTRDSQIVLKDKMQEASGIMSLDVDEYKGDYKKLKDIIKGDEFTAAIFNSPRSKLKIFVKVPAEIDNDLFWRRWVAACGFFGKRWQCEFDELKDITRACFVSWDEDAYYNKDSKVFEEIADKEVFKEKIKPTNYSILERGVVKGNRNEALLSFGASLMHKNTPPAYIKEMLLVANKKNDPPVSDVELEKIFTNIFKYQEEEEKPAVDAKLPEILLPQEDKTLVTEFIQEVNGLFDDKDLFYRVADNSIIEIIDNSMRAITPSRMISLIESVCTPGIKRWKEKEGGGGYWIFHKKTTSEQVCKVVMASPVFYGKLKRIEKVLSVSIPIFKDGEILFPKKGYNENLKLYLTHDGPEVTEPGMGIDEAKELLSGLFQEFCFKDDNDADKTKSLMGLLTPYLRGLYNDWYSRTPVFVYFANRERAGKDYLATLRILVFEGHAVEEPPLSTGKKDGGSNEELRKKFLSVLMKGKRFLHFSNNKGYINNSVFEQFATAKVYEDRPLGKNDIVAFGNDIELSMSANTGTTMTADLGHRSIVTNLFLGMEDVNKRKFDRPNLHQEIIENRGKIISAFHCLVMNWYRKGMLDGKELFTSFSQWANVCGGIIEAAGYENPLKDISVDEVGMDEETADMKALFEYMWDKYPLENLSKKEIRERIMADEEFSNTIFGWMDLDKRDGQIKFGLMMDKYSGREFENITMERDVSVKRKARQKIRFVCDIKAAKRFEIPEEEVK